MPQELTSRIGISPGLFAEVVPPWERGDANRGSGCPEPDIAALNSLALGSLLLLYDEKEELFSQSLVSTKEGLHRNGTSWRGTIIALLGLQHLVDAGNTLPFDFAVIREVILRDLGRVNTARDLGLLTWFTAVCAPDRLERLLDQVDFRSVLECSSDGHKGQTGGLALFLAGLAHARMTCPRTLPDLTDIAVDTYHLLENNQGETGLFGHATSPRSIREIFCNRYGTFSDQVYAIYALSTFARAFEIEEPIELALNCANSVCAHQGELGQWWFQYDKRRGCVVHRYPVYSAHQTGIAPTALLALEEVTGQDFHPAIWKGLSWVSGQNELGVDLRSLDQPLIWDSIEPRRRMAKYWETACSYLLISNEPAVKSLKIRYEVRPSHFGWLLYAFGKSGLAKTGLSAKATTTH